MGAGAPDIVGGGGGAVDGVGGDGGDGGDPGVATSGGDADDDGSSVLSADDVACLSCPALYEASVDVPQTQAPGEMTGESAMDDLLAIDMTFPSC